MSDGVLSQEEIDALLKSEVKEDDAVVEATRDEAEPLTPMEIDALGEIANIIMGSAATALSTLVGKKVDISTPSTELTTPERIKQEYPLPCVLVNVAYLKGLQGSNLLIIKDVDAAVIVDLMMGGDGTNPPAELSDMHLSAISEAMNQMMGSASTAISTVLKERIEISTPSLDKINLALDDLNNAIWGGVEQQVISVFFKLVIENLIDSYMIQVVPLDFAREIVQKIIKDAEAETDAAAASWTASQTEISQEPSDIFEQPPLAASQVEPQPQIHSQTQTQTIYEPTLGYQNVHQSPQVTARPAQFAPFEGGFCTKEPTNLDLIMDVPLQITVELGRARKTIRDILALGPGSVVELDKLAGEPVDILVNGKLLAKGEVVVIDENFGIRVTDIISPIERVTSLQ